MRPQLLAWLAIAAVALYVIVTVMARMDEGRCRAYGQGMDCTGRKPVVVVPSGPSVIA
jgi:hypothetical protein